MYVQQHQGPKIVNPLNFSHGYTEFKWPSTVHFTILLFLRVIFNWMNYLWFQISFLCHCSPQNGEKQTGRALHWEKIEKKKGRKKEKKEYLREGKKEGGREREPASEQKMSSYRLDPKLRQKSVNWKEFCYNNYYTHSHWKSNIRSKPHFSGVFNGENDIFNIFYNWTKYHIFKIELIYPVYFRKLICSFDIIAMFLKCLSHYLLLLTSTNKNNPVKP